MNAFKERCVKLRKRGYTLTEIMRATGRPKTSVHFHIQNIELNAKRKEEIRRHNLERLLRFSPNRKGVSKKSFKLFDRWDKEKVCFVSHFIFDGEIKPRGCVYNNRNLALLEKVENGMKSIYDFEKKRYLNYKTGVSRISYFNVVLSAYIKGKSLELLKNVEKLGTDLKIEFIKAFFDDEGCVDFRPKRNLRRVRGYQKDTSILFLVQKLIAELGIESRVVKPNEVVISGKENLMKFQKEINFSLGVRLNGNRLNSIWKKPLEKRVLLEQAILTFKN